MVSTGDVSYTRTTRCKITFKSVDGSETLFVYNSFSESNPVKLTYLEVEGAVGETGTFVIRIEDNSNAITQDLHNCKVYIQLGKSESTLHYFMIGFADIHRVDRPVTNIKYYLLTGMGSAVQAGQLFIHRREAAKIQNIDDPKIKGDPQFNINTLVKRALENKTWRPLRDESIKDITGWLTTGISSKVNINFPVVNAPFTYLSDFLEQLCGVSGAVWFIDFSTGAEVFTLTYNTDLHTGVTIKSGDLANRGTDDATKISYIKNAFGVEDASMGETGVATRLYTSTIIDATTVSSSFTNAGSTTLDFRAIAQQVIIDSDARRLDSLAFVLSKVGDPESPLDRVNGLICLDNGNNSPRNGTILDRFEIPLSSIEDSPETIFVNDINVKERLLEGGQKKIWIVLFQRSGLTGDPTHDPANTIRWHHNGVFNSNPVLATYSGTAENGDRDLFETNGLDWKNTNKGPTYTYSVFSNIRRLQSRTNKQAANTLRMREVFIPTDFLQEPNMIGRYLSLNLSQMSKARRSITDHRVTIPNNFIFKPYQIVSFADGFSGITQDLQVKRARYIISGEQGDPQIGTLHAEISLGGLYNSLADNCASCNCA